MRPSTRSASVTVAAVPPGRSTRVRDRRPRSRGRRPARRRHRGGRSNRRRRRWCGSRARAAGSATRRSCASRSGSGTPPWTRHTSVLVPPMSNATASPKPHATATAAAARTPGGRTREEQTRRMLGRVDERHETAGRRHHQHLVGERPRARPRYGAHTGSERGIGHRRDHALVLAELGRHLVRARPRRCPRARTTSATARSWARVEIGVQQAHRDRVDVVRRRGRRRRTARAHDPCASSRPDTSNRSSPGHERRRAGRRAGRRATGGPAARSRSRRRSPVWSPAPRGPGAARAARWSPPSCRGRARSGREVPASRSTHRTRRDPPGSTAP